ncbi:MAG: redoxin domain-containing protein [Thermoanaerobaculia bacterium]|nr:redoxin domain-containing protein [Thermoanaerobaculia bacterium]
MNLIRLFDFEARRFFRVLGRFSACSRRRKRPLGTPARTGAPMTSIVRWLTAVVVFSLIGADVYAQSVHEDSPLVQAAQNGRLGARFKKYSLVKARMRAPAIAVAHWYNTNRTLQVGETVLLLEFFTTSCGPCIADIPRIRDIATHYQNRITVLSIHPAAPTKMIEHFIKAHSIATPIGIDAGRTLESYGVTGVPTYFIVNSDGVVLLKAHVPPTDRVLDRALSGATPIEDLRGPADVATRPRPQARTVAARSISTGDPIRDIEASEWLNSPPLTADVLRSRVVLIDFWATWCRPCVDKLPLIQQYANRFPSLTVIGVHHAADAAAIKRYVRDQGITFPVAIDTGKTWNTFSITFVPTYLLVDRGVVRFAGTSPPTIDEIGAILSLTTK